MSFKVVVNNKPIDVASPLVRDVANVISAGVQIDRDGDGKIGWGEGFGFGQALISAVMRQYSNLQVAMEQLQDANNAERQELIQVFADGFDLPNDEVENAVEKTMEKLNVIATNVWDIKVIWTPIVKGA